MFDAHVHGDSPSVLVAALELAEVGLKVRVTLGDTPDWPAQAVRDQSGSLRILLSRVAAPIAKGGPAHDAAAPHELAPRRVLMRDKAGEWAPVPEPSVFGVPAVPASEQTLAFVKGGAAMRAMLDRVRPVLTIGKTHEFGKLVSARMGAKLSSVLVEPLVRDRFGVGADEVEVAIAVPGLNEALTRTGSLSGAVLAMADRTAERETLVTPTGGWEAARAALLELLALYDVEFGEPGDEASARAEVSEAGSGSRHVRAHATVAIDAPELPAAEPDAPDADALQTVALASGEQWSVRAARHGSWVAHLAGPRSTERGDAAAAAREALDLAGLHAVGELRVVWRAAPYVSRAERDDELAQQEARREANHDELVLGRALHGDELSAAVHDAALAAITLRRRLTGIAE